MLTRNSSPIFRLAAAAFALSTTSLAGAQTTEAAVQSASATSVDADFSRFAPQGSPNSNRIDYTAWTEAMDYLVLPMGRSLRQNPGRPDPGMGSRRIYGHDSLYRLEGNRVMFQFFTDDLKATVADYRRELETTAGLVDITSMSRNEQLSYWFNLHNVALIEQIAKAWPIRQPREILIDGVPLDEAKFITVQGVKMSPKDIRTKIVYRNWSDPRVIYGFWRGEIGGPSIQRQAFASDNVSRLLDRSAAEFINSLRGTQKRGDRLQVSDIYEEARPYFFTNWQSDVRNHVDAFADEDVKKILAETGTVEAGLYEADIADLAGGVREPTYSTVTTTAGDGIERQASFRIPQSTARMLRERETKMRRMFKEQRTGTVILHAIDLPGEEKNTEVK